VKGEAVPTGIYSCRFCVFNFGLLLKMGNKLRKFQKGGKEAGTEEEDKENKPEPTAEPDSKPADEDAKPEIAITNAEVLPCY
jgi:hypothetical protein